jgi:prophage endopeptidase
MFTLPSWLKLAPYGLCAVLGAAGMYLYHSAAMSGLEASVALERQDMAEQAANDAQQLQKSRADAQKEVSKIDQYWYTKMQTGLADLASRKPQRVYVNATCPKLPGDGDSGVDDGTRAELTAAGRQLVSELRERIVRLEAKLGAWQELMKTKTHNSQL